MPITCCGIFLSHSIPATNIATSPISTLYFDFINAAPEFIPITEAKIYSIYDNKLQTQSPLMEVKRDRIIMIFPAEAKSVMAELEDVVESKEEYSGKPLEGSFYIDPFKKQS